MLSFNKKNHSFLGSKLLIVRRLTNWLTNHTGLSCRNHSGSKNRVNVWLLSCKLSDRGRKTSFRSTRTEQKCVRHILRLTDTCLNYITSWLYLDEWAVMKMNVSDKQAASASLTPFISNSKPRRLSWRAALTSNSILTNSTPGFKPFSTIAVVEKPESLKVWSSWPPKSESQVWWINHKMSDRLDVQHHHTVTGCVWKVSACPPRCMWPVQP